MLRRQIRERREFIYRKSVEHKQRALQEKRDIVRNAVDNNGSLPTHLKKEALELVEGSYWGDQDDTVDDEYRWAGCEDPKVVITTSRDPSSALKRFAKEIKLTIPNSQTVNRGSHDVKSIVQACKGANVTDVVFLNETRGVPDSLIVSHLPHGPTCFFSLNNVVMRHDIPHTEHMSEAYPHLIFHNLDSKVGKRVTTILKHLFPVPKPDSKRVCSFTNTEDFISFRQFTHKTGEGGEVELNELGPRFELRPYSIILGTVDIQKACDSEWSLRSYTNKKKNILSVE
uniref:Brix domain-containing protein n=2 Tax=Bursaphelenchus xylophilus TaxID=6326 RepID=A0A1I7S608_BURXY